MADESRQSGDLSENAPEAALRVLENLGELEPELISAGIFDRDGKPVAVTSDSKAWPVSAAGLLDALEAGSGEEKLDSAHIASSEGEVFVVRESDLSLVAVTGRFVLASLTSYDMRMALRDVARADSNRSPRDVGNPASEAENGDSSHA